MPEGTITALRAQERDAQRVNVFIDGTFALGVSLDILAREDLYVGKYLGAEEWARLDTAEQAHRAYQAALRYIQARPRSTQEVQQRLEQRQFAPAAIESALQRLRDLDLLDDAAFARFWVENRNICHPRSQQALRYELYRKGVQRDIVDATLQDTELVGHDHERALILARGRLAQYASAPDRATFQRRLGGYLQRRGFNYDTIRPILDQLWYEVQQDYETTE